MTLVALIALGLQALLFGLMRIPSAPQYFFGTFVLHVVVAWLAVSALRPWRIGACLGALYAAGCLVLTIEAAWSIHEHGYERPLWPTLANSVSVARQLNRFTDSTAFTDVAVYQKSPQALRTQRLLLPPTQGQRRIPSTGHLSPVSRRTKPRPAKPASSHFRSSLSLPRTAGRST